MGSGEGNLKRIETAAAVLLTLLAAGLHVQRFLHAGALWRDEAGAVQLANLPTLGEVFQRFPHEAFPVLFPATIRAWTAAFGDSDAVLRLFGNIVGLAILGMLWLNARAAHTVPVASVALLGFHPGFVVYGDAIRGYGLGIVLILATLWAYVRLVERTDRRTLMGAGLAALLAVHVLLHNSALLLGIGVAAAVVGVVRKRWRLAVAALGIGFVAALSLLPYAQPLSAARDWDVLLMDKLSPGQILAALGSAAGPSWILLWAWVFFLVAGLVAGIVGRDDHSEARLFRLLVIPAAFGAQFGLFVALGYLPRIWYCLPLMAVAASVLDGALGGLLPTFPAVRAARLAAAGVVAVLLLPAANVDATLRMTNIDQVADLLEQRAGPRDVVVVNPWFYGISFHRYYTGSARWMTLPELEDHRMHRYDLFKARMAMADPLRDVRFAMRRALRSGHRVWLVGSYDLPPEGQSPPVLGPAPGGWHSGWRDAPYAISWSQQLGDYLREHAIREEEVHDPAGHRVSGFESVPLRVFQGWRGQRSQRETPAASRRAGAGGRTGPGRDRR